MVAAAGPAALMAGPQLGKIFEKLTGKGTPLSDSRIAEGLKEALKIGASNAVNLTSQKDGFLLNQAIKILLPEPLQKAEKAMRLVGMGKKLDELVVGMNRAAEAATPFAKQIFLDAIMSMTFADAKSLLKGSDTAVTDFFKEKTTLQLTELFRPPVVKVMGEVGLTKQWNSFFGTVQKMKLVKTDAIDLEGYVVSKSLSGLFYVLGQEETKIQKDPAARVTTVLKDVFGAKLP